MMEATKSAYILDTSRTIKCSTLNQSEIDYAVSLLGPFKELSLNEIRNVAASKLKGNGLSSAIIEERREAKY